MTIINPYLKKKSSASTTLSSQSTAPGPTRPALVTPSKPTNTPGRNAHQRTGVFGTSAPQPITPSHSQSRPIQASTEPVPKKSLPVTPESRRQSPIPSFSFPSVVPAGSSRPPGTISTLVPSRDQGLSSKKLTLKQKLKQEIAALKKQKQLIHLQKEAQDRRQRIEHERADKEEERKRLLEARQAQQQARVQEKLQKQQEKQQAIERKRQERLALQQAALAKQEQIKQDYALALVQYQRESEEYRIRHARWQQERQQWMVATQQHFISQWHPQGGFGNTQYPCLGPGTVGHLQAPIVATSTGNNFPFNYGFNPYHTSNMSCGPQFLSPKPSHNLLSSQTNILNSTTPFPYPPPQSAIVDSLHAENVSPSLGTSSPSMHSGITTQSKEIVPNPTPIMSTSNDTLVPKVHDSPPMHANILTATQSTGIFFPPHSSPSVFYSAQQNYSHNVAQMMHIMSYMPIHLKIPPIPPIPPKKPRCLMSKKSPNVIEQRLGAVLEPPSPYAETHVLLTITLIRSKDQPSFGVNLKAVTTTRLVELPIKEQKRDDLKTTSSDLTRTVTDEKASTDSPVVDDPVQETNNIEPVDDRMNTVEVNQAFRGNNSDDMEVDKEPVITKPQPPGDELSSTITNEPSVGSCATPNREDNERSSHPNLGRIDEIQQPDTTSSATNSVESVKQEQDIVAATKKSRPRRRRINFTAIVVVDAEKQNDRWKDRNDRLTMLDDDRLTILPSDEKTRDSKNSLEMSLEASALETNPKEIAHASAKRNELLQAGDVIVAIGGIDVAGKTFAEACRIFAEKSEEICTTSESGDTQTEIQAKLVIARKRQVPTSSKAVKTSIMKSETESNSKSQVVGCSNKSNETPRAFLNPSILSLPANSSLSFSTIEIAVLADCVIQAVHNQPTSRLLGQDLSVSVLASNTSIFRRVASLKGCILSHRSPETLFAKWSQLCQSMATNLSDRSRASWTKNSLLKESQNDLAVLPYSSDAERTALRQLPRPAQGCRCQRRDHEYLHDVRCTLYQDICGLLPPDELKELQHFNDRSQKTKGGKDDLNTVETAFKDRIVKLKTAAEMEEAEARFVARMEEVQVKQLRKAIFAPNLASMVLSSIVELQREFPSSASSLMGPGDDHSEESNTATEIVSSGKRKHANVHKGSKKPKMYRVKHLNIKYLMRIVQHIGTTWGHVYREPSHEDYAWRWELFHGHNTEGGQWESHSTNPREPNSLSFEHIRHGMEVLDKGSASKLSRASDAIAELDDVIQKEVLRQTMPSKSHPDSPSESTDSASTTCDNEPPVFDKVLVCESPDTNSSNSNNNNNTTESNARLDVADETVEQLCLAAYILSPASSGVYDEVLALVHMGVIDISNTGIPLLMEDWTSKVDFVILEDMDAAWGSQADPEGRYCINLDFRDTLEEDWVKTNGNWVLASDPDDIIFDTDVLEEWREFFQGQMEEKANITEGIGRFGL